jgi:hypothetical protein
MPVFLTNMKFSALFFCIFLLNLLFENESFFWFETHFLQNYKTDFKVRHTIRFLQSKGMFGHNWKTIPWLKLIIFLKNAFLRFSFGWPKGFRWELLHV